MGKAAVFDVDGVIVNSEPFHLKAWFRVLSHLGIPLDREEFYNSFVGLTSEQIFIRLLSRAGGKFKEELKRVEYWVKLRVDYFIEELSAGVSELAGGVNDKEAVLEGKIITPGLRGLIGALKERGYRIGAASSGEERAVRYTIEVLGLSGLFETVITLKDVERPKPDPEPYIKALSSLGVKDASSSVGFEDSPSGVRSVKNAGMRCVALTTTTNKGRLNECGADIIISDFLSENARRVVNFLENSKT